MSRTNEEIASYRLKQLLVAAGAPKILAKLLGVETSTVHKWVQKGQISLAGALLVGTSDKLGIFTAEDGSRYFRASRMRPDVPIYQWRIYSVTLKAFKAARARQMNAEEGLTGMGLLATYDGEPMSEDELESFLKAVSFPKGDDSGMDPVDFLVSIRRGE